MEEIILYCMINDFDCLVKAMSKINEDYFFSYQSRASYREILACYTENERIDLPILYEWIKKNQSIKVITSQYLIDVGEAGSKMDVNNFDTYLNQIVLRFKSNQYRVLLEGKHKAITEDENCIEMEINDLVKELEDLNEKCSIQTIKASEIQDVKKRIIESVNSGKSNISFGYKKMDKYCKPETGGLVFIGGIPGTGKTTFAMNSILRNSDKLKTAYLSYEMPDNEVIERFCQIQHRHNIRFYCSNEVSISNQIDTFEQTGIDVYDLHGKTELPIREILENNDYDLVVIDHVH